MQKHNLKKILISIGVLTIIGTGFVFANPSTQYAPTVLPQSTNTYDLGATTDYWNNIYVNTVCISGTCKSAWPSGGGGSGGGTWSTSTSPVSGQLFNFPNNNTDIVLIGNTSSTTAPFWFDPNTKRAMLTGSTTLQTATSTSFFTNIFGINGTYFNSFQGSGLTTSGGALTCATASGLIFGCLGTGDYTLFHSATTTFSSPLTYTNSTNAVTCPTCTTGGVTSVTATWPVISSGGATPNITWGGLSTTSQPSSSNLLVSNGTNGVYGVATSSATCGTGITCTAHPVIGSTNPSFALSTQNANTVMVNQTSASAAPTGLATSTFGTTLYGTGTGGQVLMWSGATPIWAATSSSAAVSGGTAGMLASWINGTTLTATSGPTAAYYTATSSTASVFPYASTTAITATTASSTNLIVSSLGGATTRCLQTGTDGTVSAAASSCGSGGSPASPSGSVQYNNSGSFGAMANFNNSSGNPNISAGGSLQYNSSIAFQASTTLHNWYLLGNAGSLGANATGTNNIGIGEFALGSTSLTGSNNVALGNNAGGGLGGGGTSISTRNVFIGDLAGQTIYTGWNNNLIGYGAGSNVTAGLVTPTIGQPAGNDGVGNATLQVNYGGSNAALGDCALCTSTSGNHNVAVGDDVMHHNLNGIQNVAIGAESFDSSNGTNNVAIGVDALGDSSGVLSGTADNGKQYFNVAVGPFAGFTASGNGYHSNIYIGAGAIGASTTGNNQLNIGQTIYGTGITNDAQVNLHNATNIPAPGAEISIGTSSPFATLSVFGSASDSTWGFAVANNASTTNFVVQNNGIVGIGTTSPYAALSVVGASGIVADHYSATGTTASFLNFASSTAASASTYCLDTCITSWPSAGGGTYPFTPSTDNGIKTSATSTPIQGTNPGLGLDVSNTSWYGIGGQLLAYASTTNRDVIFGPQSGGNNATTSATAANNTAIGFLTLMSNTTGIQNTAIGYRNERDITTGSNNTSIGVVSLGGSTGSPVTGSNNTAIGFQTIPNITSGSDNIALGSTQVLNSLQSGSFNISIGDSSGSLLTNTSNNIFLGHSAGLLSQGSNNIFFGFKTASTSSTGSNNIVIGYDVAPTSAQVSNTLNIGNAIWGTGLTSEGSTTANALIGIGTSTPYASLSVVGASGVVADHYFATTTTATSTFSGGALFGGATSIYNSGNMVVGNGGTTNTANGIVVNPAGNAQASVQIMSTGGAGSFLGFGASNALANEIGYNNALTGTFEISNGAGFNARTDLFDVNATGMGTYGISGVTMGNVGTPTLAQSAGGSIANGTYFYLVTVVDYGGNETSQAMSNQSSSIVTTGSNGTVKVSWTSVPGAAYYRIYRTTSSGTYSTPAFMGTSVSNSYTDTAASASTGAPSGFNYGGWTNAFSPTTASWFGTGGLNIFSNPGQTVPLLQVASTSSGFSTTTMFTVNTNNTTSIATTTTTGVLNIGNDPASATTTVMMGKIQFDGYDALGARYCVELVAGSFVSIAGKCNP